MKKITTLIVLLIFILSTVSAVAEQNALGVDAVSIDSDTDVEGYDDLSMDVKEEAKNQPTVPLCVRYLKNKYPNANPDRLDIICRKLKARVQTGTVDKTDIVQAMKLDENRLKAFSNLDAERKRILLNMNPEARARLAKLDDAKLARIVNLDKAQLDKLKNLDRARLRECVDDHTTIKDCLAKYKVKIVDKENLYRLREIAKNRLEAAREKYKQAKEKYQAAKDNLEKARREFKAAVDDGNEEAAVEHAKEYLLYVADMSINALEKVIATTEENDDLSEEEAADIIADLKEKIAELEDAKEQVKEADTKDEVKEAGAVIINAWNRMKHKVRLHAARIIKSKVQDVLKRAEQLEKNLEKTLAKLEERGYDTSVADEKVDEFSEQIGEARDKFEQARDLLNEARKLTGDENATQEKIDELVDEAKELIKQAHEDLKEAHELFKEIVKKIKEIAGEDADEALAEEENEEVEVIEEIECETDNDCSGNEVCDNNECEEVEEDEETNEVEDHSNEMECLDDTDCDNGKLCIENECEEHVEDNSEDVECSANKDCENDMVCINNECEDADHNNETVETSGNETSEENNETFS